MANKKVKHDHNIKSSDRDGCKIVTLRLDENTSCEINLYGATVTSYKNDGKEFIFVSSKSIFDNVKAIRGGIPLVFPNFGAWELGPQHGFARISTWTLLEQDEASDVQEGAVAASFELKDSEATRKMWDFPFRLVMSLVLGKDSLVQELKCENTGDKEFDFTALLHTYFRCEDIAKVSVEGLKGANKKDKVAGTDGKEEADSVTISGLTDTVFSETADTQTIKELYEGVTVTLKKDGLPDTVVWNPWVENAAKMADFGDDEYPSMICVEAGAVSDRVKLAAGATWSASQTISIA